MFNVVLYQPEIPSNNGGIPRLPLSSRQFESLIRQASAPSMRSMNLLDRIHIDPEVRSGKPCIRGTRITVYDILEYLAGGMSQERLLADFPSLTTDDIRASLAFAAERERRLAVTHAA